MFFEDKIWLTSPKPFTLNETQIKELELIGEACYQFYLSIESLYKHSKDNKSLLRNKLLTAPWVAEYLERGKPQYLIDHAVKKRIHSKLPAIIRPDLLITEKGFALTELDCVPGGVGLTAFLNSLYEKDFPVVGSSHDMLLNFYTSLANLSEQENPHIAIVVSNDAATYLPENQWISKQLQALGKNVSCINPKDIEFIEGVPHTYNKAIDIIYRFFELFELDEIQNIEKTVEAVESGKVILSPPMKTFHEEKMSFALFHHPSLEPFWQEYLSPKHLRTLRQIIPKTWIVDPAQVPPNAFLNAPFVHGRPHTILGRIRACSQKRP